jgi:hypothetical protein
MPATVMAKIAIALKVFMVVLLLSFEVWLPRSATL